MEALSERYGWTPDAIRQMRASDVMQYLEIIRQIHLLEKIKRMRGK